MKNTTLKRYYPYILYCNIGIFIFACGNNKGESNSISNFFSSSYVNEDDFKSKIASGLLPLNENDSVLQQMLFADTNGLLNASAVYKYTDNAPVWFTSDGLRKEADSFASQLAVLNEEGVSAAPYSLTDIERIIAAAKTTKSPTTDSIIAWDKTLTQAWLVTGKNLLLGNSKIKSLDKEWVAKNDSVFDGAKLLAASIKEKKDLPSLSSFESQIPEYNAIKSALKAWQQLGSDSSYIQQKKQVNLGVIDSNVLKVITKEIPNINPITNDSTSGIAGYVAAYQYYHQLRVSGKMDSSTVQALSTAPSSYIESLKMNMDRLRALPRTLGEEHIWVNVPLMEVRYLKDNQKKFEGRVVIGKKSRQTPTLWAPMTNIVFNPPWGVPPTILKNDVGPGVSRSGAGYLARKGLRAFDSKGNDVTSIVNGSNYKRFAYRQPPGARNALGEIKFNLPNKWDIYLHDTPHRENFASRNRALSSGCVRVQNPKVLAEAILEDKKYTPSKIDSIITTRRTKLEPLTKNLPVYIVYLTVAPDSTGKGLRYLNDVYGRDVLMKKVY